MCVCTLWPSIHLSCLLCAWCCFAALYALCALSFFSCASCISARFPQLSEETRLTLTIIHINWSLPVTLHHDEQLCGLDEEWPCSTLRRHCICINSLCPDKYIHRQPPCMQKKIALDNSVEGQYTNAKKNTDAPSEATWKGSARRQCPQKRAKAMASPRQEK